MYIYACMSCTNSCTVPECTCNMHDQIILSIHRWTKSGCGMECGIVHRTSDIGHPAVCNYWLRRVADRNATSQLTPAQNRRRWKEPQFPQQTRQRKRQRHGFRGVSTREVVEPSSIEPGLSIPTTCLPRRQQARSQIKTSVPQRSMTRKQ